VFALVADCRVRAGRAHLDNLAIIHEHDTIGDRARKPQFVRHDNHAISKPSTFRSGAF
jgi:hypothetical protein